jgi:hypothetical protein
MTDEQIKRILDDAQAYEDARENTFRSMLADFYNRKMISTVLFVWVWGLAVVAGATYSAIQFFRNVEMRDQIMYAAIFICCVQFLALTKIFAWQLIHRNGILREIKRLELRIAELGQAGNKSAI